jgi:hypothetical protein
MSYEVIAAEYFKRRYTKLRKTYRRIEEDYASLLELLENNPSEGDAVPGFGNKIYKIRMRSTKAVFGLSTIFLITSSIYSRSMLKRSAKKSQLRR